MPPGRTCADVWETRPKPPTRTGGRWTWRSRSRSAGFCSAASTRRAVEVSQTHARRSTAVRMSRQTLRDTLAASPHIHTGAFMLPGIKQFDLSGRSAIITGGSRGLGEAMAAGLASAGADVLVTSRHAEEAAATAAQLAKDYGRQANGTSAELTSQRD